MIKISIIITINNIQSVRFMKSGCSFREKSIRANAIHGNKSQTARMAALDDFKKGRCRVLVATDIAARGIDVDGITHVVNFDLPMEPESYVHRIGRTARAGPKPGNPAVTRDQKEGEKSWMCSKRYTGGGQCGSSARPR